MLFKVVKHGLFELLAVAGAIAYILLSNSLPSPGPELLAASILLFIVGALGWRLVEVIRNPAATTRDKEH